MAATVEELREALESLTGFLKVDVESNGMFTGNIRLLYAKDPNRRPVLCSASNNPENAALLKELEGILEKANKVLAKD